jgi:hypothetical protein
MLLERWHQYGKLPVSFPNFSQFDDQTCEEIERLEMLLDDVHAVFYQLERNEKELVEESLQVLLLKVQARGLLTLFGVR